MLPHGRVVSAQGENVRLLTLNIFMLPGGDNGQYKAGRLAYFTQNVLKDYDIVCLQEMFSSFSGRQSQLVDAAKRQGFEAVREEWKPLSGLVDGGLVILSRLPVVKRKHLIFRSGTKADALSRKGVLYARVRMPGDGGDLHVFSTHLQASYATGCFAAPMQRFELVRAKQLEELASFVAECTEDDSDKGTGRRDAILICGDLNVDSRLSTSESRGDSREYTRCMDILRGKLGAGSCEDLLLKHHGGHPVTWGEAESVSGRIVAKERFLSDLVEVEEYPNQSLDYAFYCPPLPATRPRNRCLGHPSAIVNPLLLSPSRDGALPAQVTHLSDHYGVEVTIPKAAGGSRLPPQPPTLPGAMWRMATPK